jgi:hypothetical protein
MGHGGFVCCEIQCGGRRRTAESAEKYLMRFALTGLCFRRDVRLPFASNLSGRLGGTTGPGEPLYGRRKAGQHGARFRSER